LVIPDPPDDADPQMAAGFLPGPVVGISGTGIPVAGGYAVLLGPVGVPPRPSARGQWSVFGGQWPASGGPAGSPVGPETTLVVQGLDPARRRELSSTGSDAVWTLESVLADLVADADRWRDGADGGRAEVLPLSGAGDTQDGFGPAAIRSDEARLAPMSRPVGVPHVDDGFIGRRLRMAPVSDAVLDELAADSIGSLGRTAVLDDFAARPATPREPREGLTGLVAILIVAGSWGFRGRFRGVLRRRAGRSRPR
jgi:hypothetical protein